MRIVEIGRGREAHVRLEVEGQRPCLFARLSIGATVTSGLTIRACRAGVVSTADQGRDCKSTVGICVAQQDQCPPPSTPSLCALSAQHSMAQQGTAQHITVPRTKCAKEAKNVWNRNTSFYWFHIVSTQRAVACLCCAVLRRCVLRRAVLCCTVPRPDTLCCHVIRPSESAFQSCPALERELSQCIWRDAAWAHRRRADRA